MKSAMKEIRERQSDALAHELADRQKHLFDLRTQAVTEKLEDPSQLRKTRKEIARIKTVLRQRQLETAATASATTSAKSDTAKSDIAESKPAKTRSAKSKPEAKATK
jgi:large subunit ribosomal protein L29